MEAQIIGEVLSNGVTQGVVILVLGLFSWNRQKRCDELQDKLTDAYKDIAPLMSDAIRVMERGK